MLFEYNPVNEDELELKVGDVVDILEEVPEFHVERVKLIVRVFLIVHVEPRF